MDWTYPEDVFPSDDFESSVRASNRLVDCPSCARGIASKPSRDVENHTDVSVNLLLVGNYLLGLYPHMTVL